MLAYDRIYLAGKAYFSSRTLLPADPSPFTLPSRSLPSASSFTVSQPSNDAQPSEEPVKTTAQAQHARRTIETGYTLDTFQTPSPDWVWMTPWMINMRTGTDEGGWRYNCWFRGKGWKSHAGMAGWAGWVRRREWVRLRTLAAEEKVLEPPMEPEEVEPGERLHVLLDEKGVDGVIKALAKLPLDRKKMETWERWLEKGDEEDKRKLQMALDDSEAVSLLLSMRGRYAWLTTRSKLYLKRLHINRQSLPSFLYSLRTTSPSPPRPSRLLHLRSSRLERTIRDSTRPHIIRIHIRPQVLKILDRTPNLPSLLREVHPQLL